MHPLMPLHAVIGSLGGLALGWCLHSGLPRTALMVGAVCAYSWAALLVEGGSRIPGLLRRWHYREWEGRYLEFEGRQIRVEEDRDGEPWVLADDAFAVMGLARPGLQLGGLSGLEYRRPRDAPDRLSLAGIRRLQKVAREPSAWRFLLWFERQVHLPAMNRVGRENVHSGRR